MNTQPENGSLASFSRHSCAKPSTPFLPSTASSATRIRICGVSCSMGLLGCEAVNQLGNLAGCDAFQLQTELAATLRLDFNDATRGNMSRGCQQFHETRRRRHCRAL